MVGHARLACDEAGHWMSRLARAEQVGRREEVKVAASENRTLSESVLPKKNEPVGHTSPNEPPTGLSVSYDTNFLTNFGVRKNDSNEKPDEKIKFLSKNGITVAVSITQP